MKHKNKKQVKGVKSGNIKRKNNKLTAREKSLMKFDLRNKRMDLKYADKKDRRDSSIDKIEVRQSGKTDRRAVTAEASVEKVQSRQESTNILAEQGISPTMAWADAVSNVGMAAAGAASDIFGNENQPGAGQPLPPDEVNVGINPLYAVGGLIFLAIIGFVLSLFKRRK